MRRPVALGCCVLYLAFSFSAGTTHVHRAAHLHDEMRGLHLGHAHFGHGADHDSDGHDHPASLESSEARGEGRQVGHYFGDALELNVTAHRHSASGLQMMPATVVTTAMIQASVFVPLRSAESSDRLRGPPRRGAIPARAPPA